MKGKSHPIHMIDFACQTIKTEDLIRCAFSLKRSDYEVLKHLLNSDDRGAREIAEGLGLDRSTVHKSLQNLRESDLVSRRQFNLSSGGYRYVYSAEPKKEIKERVLELVEDWTDSARENLENW